jgi:hypothetical protein
MVDVVQQRAAPQLLEVGPLKRQALGDGGGVFHHTLAVVRGLVFPGVERCHQGEQGVLVRLRNVPEGTAQLGCAVAHLALQLLLVALAGQLDAALGQGPLDGTDEVGQLGRLEKVVDRAPP